MQDEQIVNLYWERNDDAIWQTQVKYENYLTRIARNILQDEEDCRECVNDTYFAAWNSMPTNRPNVLATYLGKITRQLSIDVFRKHHSQKRFQSQYALSIDEFADTFTDGRTPEQELNTKLLEETINCFVRGLNKLEQTAFLGRYYFFDSLKDVARYCGMSESKTKSMLYRVRQKLKTYLLEEGFEL